jgi:phospholipid-binding lipoprotein MlaA
VRAVRRPAILACSLLAALLAAPLAGTAGAVLPDPAHDPLFGDGEAQAFPDPYEDLNRRIFAANQRMDRWVIDPVTRAYARVVPGAARTALRRFFLNLNSPSVIANDVLQREWRDAGVASGRTLVNTTVGVLGFGDPAASLLGLPRHHSDFGQTLALAGVGSGPYLFTPILGPTTVRDGVGVLVDFAFRPTTYLFGSVAFADFVPGAAGLGDQLLYGTIQGGGTGFVAREQAAEQLRALEESSVDFYATLRSAYSQTRHAAIWSRREHHRAIREQALRDHLCRPRAPIFSLAGRWQAPRFRPVRAPQCSPSGEAPAR